MESSLIIQGTQGHLIVRFIVNWMDILLPQNYLKREIIIVFFLCRINGEEKTLPKESLKLQR